jgi:phage I-like protein
MKTGGAAPARGWIVELQAREDGIWGRVEWTPTGQALLAERAYRGISPVIVHTQDGEILRVLRAALTNAPNLPLTTLHTQEQGHQMDLTKLRTALGLAEDADEAAILAAAEAARTAVTMHTQQLRRIAEAAKVPDPETAGADQIVAALQAQAAAAGDVAKLAQEVVSLQTQLTTLQQQQARERAVAAVDAAIRDGKPIPAVLREHYIARHVQDPAGVEKELAALPSLHSGGLGGRVPPAPGAAHAGLSAEEGEIVALLGLDPEAFAREKARLGQSVGAA